MSRIWCVIAFAVQAFGCTSCPTGEVTLTFVEQVDEPLCSSPIAPLRVPVRDGQLQLEDLTLRATDAGGCSFDQRGWITDIDDGGVPRTVEIFGVLDLGSDIDETQIVACQTILAPPGPRCCGEYIVRVE